jgi:hypothetical protein
MDMNFEILCLNVLVCCFQAWFPVFQHTKA